MRVGEGERKKDLEKGKNMGVGNAIGEDGNLFQQQGNTIVWPTPCTFIGSI